MSDSGKAVFLSYASQDAEAARRVCEALRAAGVEVWLDQEGGLVGGDAWDRKIREQIASCVLFLPVISAATQARREGYFRLEWKLADERTHLMAEGTPFLLPVVIDDTKDREALVPKSFLGVQWTRLPAGETNAAFCARVKNLLSPRRATGVADSGPASTMPVTTPRAENFASPATPKVGRRVPAAAFFPAALALGLVAYFVFRPSAPSPTAGVGTRPPTAEKSSAPAASDKSIAVLPFDNLSTDKENGFFADGVHEDVLTALQSIRELRVLSRTTMMQYRERGQKSLPQIARELGVTYILEGSVRRAGNKVRVSAQLIDARTDTHLWALPAGERELTDIFAVQAQLASAIAAELKAAISPQEKKLVERRPTQNPAAYDHYLKAREVIITGRVEFQKLQAREEFLQAAVQLDPQFAEAWADLSRGHAATYFFNYDHTPARLARAQAALDTAIRLAPDLPEVLHASGNLYFAGFRDFPRAREQWERALRLRPNFPELLVNLGGLIRRQGRWDEALVYYRKAASLDPGNPGSAFSIARTSEDVRRYDEAIAEFRRRSTLLPDDLSATFEPALTVFRASGSTTEGTTFFSGLTVAQSQTVDALRLRMRWSFLTGNLPEHRRLQQIRSHDGTAPRDFRDEWLQAALVVAASGDLAAARKGLSNLKELRQRVVDEPGNYRAWTDVARAEALLGHRDEALRCARQAVELVPESLDAGDGLNNSRSLAFVYAWTGDKDRALAEYVRLLRLPSGLNVHEMRRSPEYFPLQGDPRFEALLSDPKNNAPLF